MRKKVPIQIEIQYCFTGLFIIVNKWTYEGHPASPPYLQWEQYAAQLERHGAGAQQCAPSSWVYPLCQAVWSGCRIAVPGIHLTHTVPFFLLDWVWQVPPPSSWNHSGWFSSKFILWLAVHTCSQGSWEPGGPPLFICPSTVKRKLVQTGTNSDVMVFNLVPLPCLARVLIS
jgi:hypothetical protein